MTHPVRFEDALLYPFAEQRRTSLLWIPGAIMFTVHLVTTLLGVAVVVVFYAVMGELPKDGVEEKMLEGGMRLLDALIGFVVGLPLMGYVWRLMGQWQEGRENDPPPSWGECWWQCIFDGLKFMLYYIPASLVGFLPVVVCLVAVLVFVLSGYDVMSEVKSAGYAVVVLAVLVCVFLTLAVLFFVTPYLVAPVVLSSRSRKLGDLFNLGKGWALATRHYGAGLKVTGWMIAAGFVYTAGNLALMCSCIGCLFVPFLQFPYWVTLAYLAHQAFPPEETQLQPA